MGGIKKCSVDGCENLKPPISLVKGMCNKCASKYKKQQGRKKAVVVNAKTKSKNVFKNSKTLSKKAVKKRQKDIVAFYTYARTEWERHKNKNGGRVCCEECGVFIGDGEFNPKVNGYNCSHILPKSTHPEHYYSKKNRNWLCRTHHDLWSSDPKSMNIYEKNLKIIKKLLIKTQKRYG